MNRLILPVFALALTFGFAGSAPAAELDKSLSNTKWKHVAGNEVIRFEFNDNGTFTWNFGANGVVRGIYTLEGSSLDLKVISRDPAGGIKVDHIGFQAFRDGDRLTLTLKGRERMFQRE